MKNYAAAAYKLAELHEQERQLCLKYRDACEDAGDEQHVKDFNRLVREHCAAAARYGLLGVQLECVSVKYSNLDVTLPDVWYM